MQATSVMPDMVASWPYRLLVAIVLCIAAGAGGWSQGASHIQAKWDKERAELAQAGLKAEQEARETERQYQKQLQEAQHAANTRVQKIRADADSARAAADILRDSIAAIAGQLPAATPDASRDTAATSLQVLGECADQYRAVAEAADGHASDVRTLMEAWPR